MGICLGNNQSNFQLHRFIRRENIAKSFRGATFLTHTVDSKTDKPGRPTSDHVIIRPKSFMLLSTAKWN